MPTKLISHYYCYSNSNQMNEITSQLSKHVKICATSTQSASCKLNSFEFFSVREYYDFYKDFCCCSTILNSRLVHSLKINI